MNGDSFQAHRRRPALFAAAWVLTLLLAAASLQGQDRTPTPTAPAGIVAEAAEAAPAPGASPVAGVGVEQKVGAALPDLPFYNETGERVTLHQYLGARKPVLLTLNYYRCPMLCDVVLNEVAGNISELGLVPGEDYEVVTISFDPAETPSMARDKKATYLRKYGDVDGLAEGWHFLTGEKQHIDAVADAVGYGYEWVESRKQYAHPAVVMLITPDGRVSRYLFTGRPEAADTLRLSLVEASDGKIGSTLDQILLTCFVFDAGKGEFTWNAMLMMRIGGVLTVAFLLSTIAGFLVWEHRRKSHDADAAPAGRSE